MSLRALRVLLISAAALTALMVTAVIAVLAFPAAPRGPLYGCERYPLFHHVWACPSGVYLRKNGRMEYMGRVTDLAPMPAPPPKEVTK